jgi:hypothetical protein
VAPELERSKAPDANQVNEENPKMTLINVLRSLFVCNSKSGTQPISLRDENLALIQMLSYILHRHEHRTVHLSYHDRVQ